MIDNKYCTLCTLHLNKTISFSVLADPSLMDNDGECSGQTEDDEEEISDGIDDGSIVKDGFVSQTNDDLLPEVKLETDEETLTSTFLPVSNYERLEDRGTFCKNKFWKEDK